MSYPRRANYVPNVLEQPNKKSALRVRQSNGFFDSGLELICRVGPECEFRIIGLSILFSECVVLAFLFGRVGDLYRSYFTLCLFFQFYFRLGAVDVDHSITILLYLFVIFGFEFVFHQCTYKLFIR